MSTESKILDLVKVIGKETAENFSPTLRAKLVAIDVLSGMCTMEVVESHYVSMVQGGSLNYEKIGTTYNRPIPYVWNAFFF
jgi:hypothetical protein